MTNKAEKVCSKDVDDICRIHGFDDYKNPECEYRNPSTPSATPMEGLNRISGEAGFELGFKQGDAQGIASATKWAKELWIPEAVKAEKSRIAEGVEKKSRKYVTQPARYKGSDANVWREGFNAALDSVKSLLK